MNNNKGFTLIELIAVITILAVVALITVPIVNKAIVKSKEKALKTQQETIVDAAKKYALENTEILPEYDLGQRLIYINDLINDGYLEKKPIDPVTDEEMTDCVKVTYDQTKNKYTYVYGECKVNISIQNTYPNGGRLIYIYDGSSEETATINDLFGTESDMDLTIEDSATLEKYSTENLHVIKHGTAIIFDTSDKAVDGMMLFQIRIEKSDIYMDLYNLFSNAAKEFNTKIGFNAMYIFGKPENLSIYLGVSIKTMAEHDAESHFEEFEQELAVLSNKNVHTISDVCNAMHDYYMTMDPAPTEPFECPFETFNITEIQMDQ